MLAFDANFSLKRMAAKKRQQESDIRTFDSDYIIPTAEVNQFKDEVKPRHPRKVNVSLVPEQLNDNQVVLGDNTTAATPRSDAPYEDEQTPPNDSLPPMTSTAQQVEEPVPGLIPMAAASDEDDDEEDKETLTTLGEEGLPTSVEDKSGCATNWKANATEEKKKMWSIFAESGIFACACRHGLILWITDMVRSGEL